MTPLMLDLLLKAGIPAGLGVFVVVYLIRVLIPGQQRMFTSEMEASRKTFEKALENEQNTHSLMMTTLTATLIAEGAQTRAAIDRLNQTSLRLTEVVHKMSGVVSTLPEHRG